MTDTRFCGSRYRGGSLGVLGLCLVAALTSPAAATPPECVNNQYALGVARTVEIDTTGGPGFGFEHYKVHDFLQNKEVVLTFDDGPQKFSTEAILDALDQQCTKATFFSIGKMALGYPQILRDIAARGHTIGTHTWSHTGIRKAKTPEAMKEEIEKGISGVALALGRPADSFFRYPFLLDTPESLTYLAGRDIGIFSTDIDSFDFKVQKAEHIVKTVMTKLETKGKGIILMHDIHKTTAKAVPLLLTELKAKGYKVVHVVAKLKAAPLPEYDELLKKEGKGLVATGDGRPTSSIVRTIEGEPAAGEAPPPGAPAVPATAAIPQPEAPNPDIAEPATGNTTTLPPSAAAAEAPADAVAPASSAPPAAAPVATPPAPETAPVLEAPAEPEPKGPFWERWFGK